MTDNTVLVVGGTSPNGFDSFPKKHSPRRRQQDVHGRLA
jgi:hypothetical protein